MLKKVLIHTRRGLKITILTAIAAFLIIGTIAFLFKPTYSVTINGEQVGYTENRAKLQHEINNYAEKGNEDQQNVAFVQIQNLPEYKLCLLKKNIVTNQEEKLYVSNFEEAEQVVNSLKEKNSTNIDQISIVEKYETDIQDLVTSEEAISKLYVEPEKKAVTVAKTKTKTQTTTKYASSGRVNTAGTTSTAKASIGISLIKPVSGIITSRFGAGSAIRRSAHTGLDIATSTGTPIKAAASGTVTFAGYKGSYGNMIVITHANGIQTYYGHCSALYVSAGATVSQGQTIGAVGSTGNSTGPHLHLEVRVNGVAYNPQNYVY